MEERLPQETPVLRAFLRKLALGSADFDIDDLVQETMNRALRYQQSYDRTRPLRQWLFAIGFRVFVDSRNRLLRVPGAGGTFDGAESVVAPCALAANPHTDIGSLLAALDDPEKGIVERTYLHSKTIAQVAVEMRMAEGTVKSHLHRARKRLADRFEKEDWI
jgi:RNA polymerase sigma-70 factor, ECF subfamily